MNHGLHSRRPRNRGIRPQLQRPRAAPAAAELLRAPSLADDPGRRGDLAELAGRRAGADPDLEGDRPPGSGQPASRPHPDRVGRPPAPGRAGVGLQLHPAVVLGARRRQCGAEDTRGCLRGHHPARHVVLRRVRVGQDRQPRHLRHAGPLRGGVADHQPAQHDPAGRRAVGLSLQHQRPA